VLENAVDETLKDYFANPEKFQRKSDAGVIKQFADSGLIENGLKEGQWIEYSLDSIPVSENATLVVGGKSLPMKTSYFLKKDVGRYSKNMKTGVWILYQSFDTEAPFHFTRTNVKNYKKGKLDGEETYYQAGGDQLLAKCYWKDGIKDGIGEEYDYNYPYNKVLSYKMKKGKTVLQQSFYPNGKVENEQTYSEKNGKEIIFAKNYSQTGQLNYTGYFTDEVSSGTWTYYHENGQVKSIENKTNGNYKFYFDNGQLCFEAIYKNGKLMEVISNFTKDGKMNDPGTLKNGTGILKLYDPDGKLTETVEYVDGKEKK
jgi:antitoxin component YwqK of YwqJK toxin-antitoxin module